MRALALLLVLTLAPLARSEPSRPHVYLVVVDGLGADQLDLRTMPRLTALGREGLRCDAHASMPTRTNPSHATLLTGTAPESHGITGNGYWDRAGSVIQNLDRAELLEVETLFTVAETAKPARHTIAAFSKPKLGRLFEAVPGRQKAPDAMWLPSDGGMAGHVVGIAGDGATMDGFLAAAARREPDLGVINLSEVDRAAHMSGPTATATARRRADEAIGRLIDDLHARGRWERSVVLVTSDHGFDTIAATSERRDPVIDLGRRFAAEGIDGVAAVGDGGTAHVYATRLAPGATEAGPAAGALAWAAAVAWREPGVAEVVARIPVDGVPNLADVHPEWGLAHERAGELLIVAHPGFHFIDATDAVSGRFRGNHGSPREARVPLVIGGGALAAPPPTPSTPPSGADVGATIAVLLDLRPVRRFDRRPARLGKPLALSLRGATYKPHWEK